MGAGVAQLITLLLLSALSTALLGTRRDSDVCAKESVDCRPVGDRFLPAMKGTRKMRYAVVCIGLILYSVPADAREILVYRCANNTKADALAFQAGHNLVVGDMKRLAQIKADDRILLDVSGASCASVGEDVVFKVMAHAKAGGRVVVLAGYWPDLVKHLRNTLGVMPVKEGQDLLKRGGRRVRSIDAAVYGPVLKGLTLGTKGGWFLWSSLMLASPAAGVGSLPSDTGNKVVAAYSRNTWVLATPPYVFEDRNVDSFDNGAAWKRIVMWLGQ